MPKHEVRFEPVGTEVEVDEEETVLGAAFWQSSSIFQGCKEGYSVRHASSSCLRAIWRWTVIPPLRSASRRGGEVGDGVVGKKGLHKREAAAW